MKLPKKIFLLVACALLSWGTSSAVEMPKDKETKTPQRPSNVGSLDENRIEDIYIGYNLLTTLSFKTKRQIQKITTGSNVVECQFDAELQQLELRARSDEGVTNMNIVIDGRVYRFIVHIVRDQRKFFARSYTIEEERDGDLFAAAAGAKPLRPDQIDVVGMTNTIERARIDQAFKRTVSNVFTQEIKKTYAWNGCPVTLHDATYFADTDTLVLRIEFFNNGSKALYLHAKQYRIMVGGREFPATVRTQLISTVFPGQMDKVYLFVQGYRVDPRNDWEIVLPPEAESIRSVLGVR